MRIAIVSVTLFATQLLGGVNQWTSRGPSGGSIMVVVADRSNPAVMYIGTNGSGVMKSEDAGASWRPVNEGLSDLNVLSLVMRRDRPGTLFAGTTRGTVMRTRNGGASWTEVLRLSGGIWSIGFDHSRGSIYTLALGSFDLMRSDDDGATWDMIHQQMRLEKLTVLDGKLYALSEGRPLVSDNRGSDWKVFGGAGRSLSSVAVDEERSRILFAGVGYVTRSADAGKTWETLLVSGLPLSDNVAVNSMATYAGGVLVASDAGVLRYGDGTGWAAVGDVGKGVSAILRTEANAEHIYVFSRETSLLYDWTAAQSQWLALDTRLQSADTQDIAVAGTSVYAATWQGLATHGADSEEWTAVDVPSSWTLQMDRVTATSSGVIAVSNSSGVHRSDDGGTTWKRINTSSGVIAIAGSDQKTMYAALANGISKTTDGGDTWFLIRNDMPYDYYAFYYGFFASAIEVDRSSADLVYLCANNLFKTTDGGAHWKQILGTARGVAVDSVNSSLLYAVDYRGNAWRSIDAGANWLMLSIEGVAVAVAADPARASVAYLATSEGKVYRSANGGRRWIEIGDGLSGASINKLALDSSGNRLYAATSGGVFEYLRDTTYLEGATTYSVSLQTQSSNWVSADDCGDGRVVANASSAGPCETFTLYDINGGALNDGDKIYIQAANGSFLVAENGGFNVNANRLVARLWETFTIRGVLIGDKAKIGLQSFAGGYVSAVDGGGNDSDVKADRPLQKAWETFTLRMH